MRQFFVAFFMPFVLKIINRKAQIRVAEAAARSDRLK
jgi:hypothetical protein